MVNLTKLIVCNPHFIHPDFYINKLSWIITILASEPKQIKTMQKKYIFSFLIAFVLFAVLGGAFGTLVFLPEMESWYQAFPDAVRETPDVASGFLVGIIQLVGLIYLMGRLNIDTFSEGAVFGAIYSVAVWLIVDLQMVSVTNIVSYDYVALDAGLSAVMGVILGAALAWSMKRFA